MIETISNKKSKARKEHLCSYCEGTIKIGEIYGNSTHKYEGHIYTWKNHLKCQKLAEDLGMFHDLWSDGLDSDEFMYNVQEFLNINIDDADIELFGEEAVDKSIEILKNK